MALTLDELKALYGEKGATQRREEQTEKGIQYYDEPVQLGEGWTAYEKQPTEIVDWIGQGMDATPIYKQLTPEEKLGGFTKQEGDYVTTYDLNGNVIDRHKWNESDLKTAWNDLGPIAMAALAGPGGAEWLGNSLFGLSGTAAAGAGGALAGGFNASMNDQNILKGALLGGAAGVGSAKLGDVLGADTVGSTFKNATVGDVTKAINLIQNPSLAGAASLASPYMPDVSVGDGALSLNDVLKGVSTAQALSSGDERQIFNAIKGIAGNTGSLKSSLAGFEANPEDFIEGYFQPGGEGYLDLGGQDMTVREDPENLDALLRSLSPYQVDGGTSIFTQPDDIPEMETVDKRPTSFADLFPATDIMQTVGGDKLDMGEQPEMVITDKKDEPYVPSIRTKDIVSSIPDEVITADQITKLFPDLDINSILQTVTPAKTTAPTKTTTPAGTKSTQQLMANLGLGGGEQTTIQDPYAHIKLMEELFGPDIAYKLSSLGENKRK